MVFGNSKFVSFEDDLETAKSTSLKRCRFSKLTKMISGKKFFKSGDEKELTRVFSEDYAMVERMVLDPRGPAINSWNKCLFVACLVSLFVDPLFFYLPIVKDEACIDLSKSLKVVLTIVRSIVDVFYMVQIFVRFRTAYVSPSSRVIGRGELVIDPKKIGSRYIHKNLWVDILAALPIPQVLAWAAFPYMRGADMMNLKIFVRLTVIIQFLLRLYLIFPLSSEIVKATGVVMKTAWAGAAYNLILFMLASHVIGSSWYLLAIERQEECWKEVCSLEQPNCQTSFFDCKRLHYPARASWFESSNVTSLCDLNANFFQFGIYGAALDLEVTQLKFFNKYLYCFWWGLQNLSSLGQNLSASTYPEELIFVTIIAILGLLLFALLIGNMQRYLQSTNMRLEEWRMKRNDKEQWMRHRQLTRELKESVRRYDQYRWVTTHGVDEEAILNSLPLDLRRDIKRHLCLNLVRKVPFFNQMDEHMLDAICERLKPVLCTSGTCLVRESDPVNEMLFIIRGHLDSYTTDGGRTGFFNSSQIGPGDFCGEELLTWALDPRPTIALPSSTRTVKAISEAEAFALVSEDLKFVASKFRVLHSKQMKHTFRCHSHQWRTWAACFIQAVWFRYKRRRQAAEIKAKEGSVDGGEGRLAEAATEKLGTPVPSPRAGWAVYAAILTGNSARGGGQCGSDLDLPSPLQKPKEPDFFI
ncbi:Protein CNGC15c like [Actinidia chinensis var. chinensis]|uniref:Protein CNGC15c like n=1 Tax=Actinidia chinensis var. chinensis TaxID=1590841 RepID=A0A2R6PWN0_ACTCC|nr:Protein CNGC15c like [Actinidia chinensis var. chinensis]